MDDHVAEKATTQSKLGISPSLVIFLTTLIDMIGFGMIIPLLPFHPETVRSGALALGILIGSFSLMQFIFSPVLGRLSDKVGGRPVILLSIFSSAVSFVVFAFANSFLLLLISRMRAHSSSLHLRHNHRKRESKGNGKSGGSPRRRIHNWTCPRWIP